MHSARPGFSLIELLIVVAIIGLIASISAFFVNTARIASRDNKRLADLSQVQKGLELGYGQTTGYPVVGAPTALGAAGTHVLCGQAGTTSFEADATLANCDADKVYIGIVPSDPGPGGTTPYMYESDGQTYCISTSLEGPLPALGLSAGSVRVDPTAVRNGTCP